MSRSKLSSNALVVLEKRYFAKNEKGEVVEDADGFFSRIANAVAEGEPDASLRQTLAERYRKMMEDLLFLPNTPTLINAGRKLGQLSACFVLPVEDSIEGIFETIKKSAMIAQSGGGCGFSFSRLRAKDSIVKSTGGKSSGPVSFMKSFNSATESVKQGSVRRGALMGILRCDHPDILEFVDCKQDLSQLTNFNISVAITDKFMEALKNNQEYELVDPGTKAVVKTLSAKLVWDKIVKNARETGEPGLFFIDRANENNPIPSKGPIEATNPCVIKGTRVLTDTGYRPVEEFKPGDFVTCSDGISRPIKNVEIHENLPVLRVTFSDGSSVTATAAHQFYVFDDKKMLSEKRPVCLSNLRIGSVVEAYDPESASTFPLSISNIESAGKGTVYDLYEPETDTWVTENVVSRGCGEQPLGDFQSCTLSSIDLVRHVKNGALDWAELENTTAVATEFLDNVVSINKFPIPELAEVNRGTRRIGLGIMGFSRMLILLGIPYDSEEGLDMAEKVMSRIREVAEKVSLERAQKYGVYPYYEGIGPARRNSHLLTIAPTGTISMIADTSSGCEPEFSLIWYKNVMDGTHLAYTLPLFEEVAKREGFWSEDLPAKIVANHGSCRGIAEVPEKWQRIFATAHDIEPQWHVRMQAAFQKYIDSAVSKTINLPREATVDDVHNAYLLAYDLGCKGITVYRDGSRENQVLNIGESKKDSGTGSSGKKGALSWGERAKGNGESLTGARVFVKSRSGKSYVHLYHDSEGRPIEIFVTPATAHEEKESAVLLGRLGSLALQYGAPLNKVMAQFVKAHEEAGTMGSDVHMIVKAIGKLNEDIAARNGTQVGDIHVGKCPECRSPVAFQEGCLKCTACGFSKC